MLARIRAEQHVIDNALAGGASYLVNEGNDGRRVHRLEVLGGDRIWGEDGDDALLGQGGEDEIDGVGTDVIDGGNGRNTIRDVP